MFPLNFDFSNENLDGDLPVTFLGGSSFIGLNTAQTLFYLYNLYCSFYKSQAPNFFPEFIWSRINFIDPKMHKKLIRSLIKRSSSRFLVNFIDIPVSTYPKITLEESIKLNTTINAEIIELCNELEVYPIFISSDHVFSGDYGPYKEDSEPNPKSGSFYGQQKYDVEQLYQQKANNYTIIRLSSILGLNLHFQKENLYSRVLSRVKNKQEIQAATNKFRSPSHVYNVAFFLHKLLEQIVDGNKVSNKNIFHLPGIYMSEFDLFKEIAISHYCNEDLIIPYKIEDETKMYPLDLGLNSDTTQKVIDARFLTLKEGLQILDSDFDSAIRL